MADKLKGLFGLCLAAGVIFGVVRCQVWVDNEEYKDNCKMKYATIACHEAKIEMIKAKAEYQKKLEGISDGQK